MPIFFFDHSRKETVNIIAAAMIHNSETIRFSKARTVKIPTMKLIANPAMNVSMFRYFILVCNQEAGTKSFRSCTMSCMMCNASSSVHYQSSELLDSLRMIVSVPAVMISSCTSSSESVLSNLDSVARYRVISQPSCVLSSRTN